MTNHEKLLQNIDKKYLSLWQDIEQNNSEINQQLDNLSTCIETLKKLNNDKKILSSKIGNEKKAGNNIETLIAEQRELKSAITEEKSHKSNIIEKIKVFFDENTKQFPDRYQQLSVKEPLDQTSSVRLCSTQDIPAEKIISFLRSHNQSTPYHYPCWQSLFQQVFHQQDVSIIALDTDDTVVGLFPLTLFSSALFGKFVVSIPYFNYGGPISRDTNIETMLLDEAIAITKKHDAEHLELRELVQRKGYQNKQEKVSMLRVLPSSTELFSLEIDTKLRAQINRSKDYKPVFKTGRHELLNDYYKVFAQNMRDLGTPVYSKNFFSSVLDAWPDTFLGIVYLDGKPVACAFLLGYKNVLEIPWASALKKTNSIGINMYMYYCILNHAIENNYQYFDFGRSSKDSGTFRFKQQWGAKPVQNYWNYWLPEGQELPQINPNNPKYKLFIQAWKTMPTMITNVVGPHIVKNIP